MSVDSLIDGVIQREGGYVDHPSDRGGPTKHGITLAALHDWRKCPVSAYDVQQLTEDEARRIYRDRYFTQPGLDMVTDAKLQELLFDFAVNSGPRAAVAALQRALSLPDDGSLGPITQAAVKTCTNLPALFYRVKCERYEMLLRYVGGHSEQSVFGIGWANRLDQFEEAI